MEELSRLLAAVEVVAPERFFIAGVLALLILFVPGLRKRRGLAIDLRRWISHVPFRSRRLLALAIPCAIATLLLAAGFAEPRITVRPSVSIYGKPVVAVVDVSGSMGSKARAYIGGVQNKDQRNGYEKARDIFMGLIGRRPDVNFALLLYSTENYVARYFTYKNELFQDTIENLKEIEYISTGTRTSEALAKARVFLTDQVTGTDKAIVLISDMNGDLEATVATSEELEREGYLGIKVYILLITTDDKKPSLPVRTEGLQIIEMNDVAGIDAMVREIAEMRSSPLRQEAAVEKESLIPYVMAVGLGLMLGVVVLTETRWRKIP